MGSIHNAYITVGINEKNTFMDFSQILQPEAPLVFDRNKLKPAKTVKHLLKYQ